MKYLLKAALLVITIIVVQPLQSDGMARKSPVTKGSTALTATEAQKLISRLDEIKAMEKSTMTKSEKRALRNEVKAIHKTMDSNGRVYLSVGAVIIIVLLLILLL